jgi:hypothetical protein
MEINPSGQDPTAVIRPSATDQVQAIDRFVSRFYWSMVARADRIIRLRRIPRPLYDGEDAVVAAWYKLRRAAEGGRLDPIQTSGHLWRLFGAGVNREIRMEQDRLERRKRGGPGVSRAGRDGRRAPEEEGGAATGRDRHWDGDSLDHLISPQPPPEVLASSKEQIERLLDHLGSPVLRTIATLLAEGYGNEELARRLGRTTRTIERQRASIRRGLSGSEFGR